MAFAGAATGAAGSILGVIGGLIKKKVKAPDFVPVNPGAEAGKAIEANLSNLPQAQALAAAVNSGNNAQLLASLRAVIPNFDEITSQASSNIASQLKGEIPQDVANQIYRHSGSVGVANGTGGSEFGRNLTTRDLGLNSLSLMQQGFSNANQWLSTAKNNLTAPLFSPSSMFISPAEMITTTAANNAGTYNSQFLKNQLAAAQAPATIVGNGLEQFGASLGSMGSLGGTGGGGTAGQFGVSSILGSGQGRKSTGTYGNGWGEL